MPLILSSKPPIARKIPVPRASSPAGGPQAVCNPLARPLPTGHPGPDLLFPAAPAAPAGSPQEVSCIIPFIMGRLVGTGGVSDPDHCGKYRGAKCLTEGHKARAYRTSCGDYSCPICFPQVAYNDAIDAVERLENGKRLTQNDGRSNWHYTVSPPESVWGKPGIEYPALRGIAMRLIRRFVAGPFGGIFIYHAMRFTEVGDALYELYMEGGGQLHAWDWYRAQTDPAGLAELSPHWHYVGDLYIGLNSDAFEVETGGWVYKKISDKPLDREGTLNAIKYALSHKTMLEGRESHTFVGYCSKRSLKVVETSSEEPDICEECGCQRHVLGEEQFGPDGGLRPMFNPDPFATRQHDGKVTYYENFNDFVADQPLSFVRKTVRVWSYSPPLRR